jgi:hypothetical protein
VLDDDDIVGRGDQTSNDLGRRQPLPNVKVRRRLVEHVHVRLSHGRNGNSKPLQLSSRKLSNLSIQQLAQLQLLLEEITVGQLGLSVQHLAHRHVRYLYAPWNLVDVLRLRHGLDVVLEHLGEEVLQLRPSEVLQDLGPFGRVVVPAQVRLELTGEDFESGRFTDTVCADQTEHLARTWCWQSVQLEGVGGVSVSDVGVEVGWQVENLDRFEWAPFLSVSPMHQCSADPLLHTDTTSNAQLLRDERLLI